ncbi:uncharacterized protein DMAD_13610 [Drosophila madeirensis]|uniref:Integrase catalytic domain-containing protein n=1 Tax=Drosophila madeirensis TaxID=30013 RepID=A0AAU9GEG6_DROMD
MLAIYNQQYETKLQTDASNDGFGAVLMQKYDVPLQTYHIDFLGPLESTSKNYKHILVVIDAFTKFCWLYPTKSTTSNEVILKLRSQSVTFGNPACIISDRGSAFTAQDFLQYCEDEKIKLVKTTTGLPRVNGQVERLNSVIISVLAKLNVDDPSKWFKHDDQQLQSLIQKESIIAFEDDRNELRAKAKTQILNLQAENKNTYNLRRKPPRHYDVGDLVAIKKTQFGSGLKLKPKFLGPYQIIKVKHNNAYDVKKVGNSDGPKHSSSCAEYLKPWSTSNDDDSDDAFEASA